MKSWKTANPATWPNAKFQVTNNKNLRNLRNYNFGNQFHLEFCTEDPESGSCRNITNMWFFNRNHTRCDVFTWSCGEHGNKFPTNDECIETCTGRTLQFQSNKRKGNKGRNRNRNND